MSITCFSRKFSCIRRIKEVVYFSAIVGLVGCSVDGLNAIPGVTENEGLGLPTPEEVKAEKEPSNLKSIPVSRVVDDVRRQIDGALCKLHLMKLENRNNLILKGLNPRAGTGVVTGKTQLVNTDAAGITTVFPFSGAAGSTLSPNIGASQIGTGVQELSFTFSYTPPFFGEQKKPWECNIDDYISKSLVGIFNTIVKISAKKIIKENNDEVFSGTAIESRELKLTLNFSVARTGDVGLGVKIVPASPNIDSITTAPDIGIKRQTTGTNTFTLTMPLVTANTADDRRIIQGTTSAGETIILIEEPYTETRACQLGVAVVKQNSEGETVDVCPEILSKLEKEAGIESLNKSIFGFVAPDDAVDTKQMYKLNVVPAFRY